MDKLVLYMLNAWYNMEIPLGDMEKAGRFPSAFQPFPCVEGLRRELSPSGVRVSLLEPGTCLTGFQSSAGYNDDIIRTMTDQYGPLLHVNDIANTIHYIVSQPPRMSTFVM
ncbi:MAG: hypothetical protein LC660_05795 [Desulfobacteraceae bacterium]|nr:hypothetical protein [Desulfobacteraceae bacterium]